MARKDLDVARSCMKFYGYEEAARKCESLSPNWRQGWELFANSPNSFLSYDGVPFVAPQKFRSRPTIG